MSVCHFIRPWWFLALLPWAVLWLWLLRQQSATDAWRAICDPHLFPYLLRSGGERRRTFALSLLMGSLFFMIIGLSGPAWKLLPVPIFHQTLPHVVLLDMSDEMYAQDISPSRLDRAKFILHDLFRSKDSGQFAMIAYSSVPFVVSPMTDDAETIDALLASLTAQVMPVSGYNLDDALQAAKQLFADSGYRQGSILILTTHEPNSRDIGTVQALWRQGIATSIVAVTTQPSGAFARLSTAGHGRLITLSNAESGLKRWLSQARGRHELDKQKTHAVPMWQDEGRWLLLPALLLLLPVFARGWLARVTA